METAVKNTRVEFSLREGLTKGEITRMAQNAVDSVLEKGNVLQVAEVLAGMEAFIKAVKADERFPEYVREELSKHPKGKYESNSGAKIEMKETGTTYDYTGNAAWVELNREVEALKEKQKALEDRLKKIPSGMLLVDEESGETLCGPAKSSRSSYSVTLAK